MVRDCQKRARDKWNKEHMATIACRLKREQADEFKRIAEGQGKTTSQMLREFVIELLENVKG
jgi:predicted DNA-binding protein